MIDGVLHEVVHRLAGGNRDRGTGTRRGFLRHALGGDVHDDAVPAEIVEDDVASRSEDEDGDAAFVVLANGVDEFLLGLRHHERLCRATHFERGVTCHRFVMTGDHVLTVAVAFASTEVPSHVAPSPTTIVPSSLTALIFPVNVTSTPSSVSGTTTGRVNRTW